MPAKTFVTVDTHTEGDPTRFLMLGYPYLKENTMVGRMHEFENSYDDIRKVLMQEPRGYQDMFGAVITPPTTEGAAFGVIFMDNGGYLNMCGHGIMAAATIGKKYGLVSEDATEVNIDTAAGVINAKYIKLDGDNFKVEITSVPSFAYETDVTLSVEGIGEIKVDISYGGNFFTFVQADALGLNSQSCISDFRDLGMRVKKAVNEQVQTVHPEMPHIDSVDLVEILLPPTLPGVNCKNVVVFGDGQIGRDPCGTGTTAKMALEYAKGRLPLNTEYKKEGLIGTVYTGKVIEEVKVGKFVGVVPVISGSTYITGTHTFTVEAADVKKTGWLV